MCHCHQCQLPPVTLNFRGLFFYQDLSLVFFLEIVNTGFAVWRHKRGLRGPSAVEADKGRKEQEPDDG
jgi:hypothetical protein